MCDVAFYADLDFVLWAVAVEISAGEVGVAFCEAVVDEWVDRGRHCENVSIWIFCEAVLDF